MSLKQKNLIAQTVIVNSKPVTPVETPFTTLVGFNKGLNSNRGLSDNAHTPNIMLSNRVAHSNPSI
jgi:hypothetical protein